MSLSLSCKTGQSEEVFNNSLKIPLRMAFDQVGKKGENDERTDVRLGVYLWGYIFSFLESKDLGRLELVCTIWKQCITQSNQWELQCKRVLNLSLKTDPIKQLPQGGSYKENLKRVLPHIFGKEFYERYVGDIGPVPPIPEEISLKRWEDPDPCDPNKKIGREYVWMYCPSHLKKGNLKIALTINTIAKLFISLKSGNPSTYSFISNQILKEHGDERIPEGWICMRRELIGNGLSFAKQKDLAKKNGVVIPNLAQRILFNFLSHICSKKVGIYPDGQPPQLIQACEIKTSMDFNGNSFFAIGRFPSIIARTSTLIRDLDGNHCPSCCGPSGISGMRIDISRFDRGNVGVAVALNP